MLFFFFSKHTVAQSSPMSGFTNDVVLEHSHIHLCLYIVYGCLHCKAELRNCDRVQTAQSLKHLLSGPSQKNMPASSLIHSLPHSSRRRFKMFSCFPAFQRYLPDPHLKPLFLILFSKKEAGSTENSHYNHYFSYLLVSMPI